MAHSLRRLVLGGTRGLSDDAVLVLRTAAVGEGLLDPDFVRRVSGLPEQRFDLALVEARERGLLRTGARGDVLRFRHAPLREAIDSELLARDRRIYHRRWAAVLDVVDPADFPAGALVMERGRHWYSTGEHEAAFASVLRAAQLTERVPDFALQARWWSRVLELWGPTGPGPDPTMRGDEEREGVRRDWAVEMYGMALSGLGDWAGLLRLVDSELVGEADWLRSLWLRAERRHARSVLMQKFEATVPAADLEPTVARLGSHPPDFRADQALHLLLHECEAKHPELCMRIATHLLKRAEESGDAMHVHLAMRHQGWLTLETGDPDGALRLAESARRRMLDLQASSLADADADLVWAYVEAGSDLEAVAHAERWLANTPDPRVVLLPYVRLVAGYVSALLNVGEWTPVIERADDPLVIQPYDAVIHQAAVAAHARRGERGAAYLRYGDLPSVEVANVAGDMENMAGAVWAALELAAWWGIPADGWSRVDQWRKSVPAAKTFMASWNAAVAAARSSATGVLSIPDAGRAQDLASPLVGALPDGGAVGRASAAEVAAHAARRAGSDHPQQWVEAAEGWAAVERPYDLAWCRLLEAQCRLRTGDRADARPALNDALDHCDRLGAKPLRDLVTATSRRGRLDVDGAGSAASLNGLTSREAEVLRLLSAGRTNGQIASELFISPKTVSVHVSRIIAKVGVANRTEAAAYAHRQGLVES